MKYKIKREDQVIVTTGKHKGKLGKVLKVFRDNRRVLVEGINIVSRNVKPTAERQGGVVKKEASLDISNVALWNAAEGRRVKVGVRVGKDENGKRTAVRFDKKTQETID
jgi:large subunit ribosomal protein L24